jgi:serine/threonine protein kinase
VAFGGAFHRDGVIGVVLEWMDGGTLADAAARAGGRLPEPAAAAVAFQLLWALAYLRIEHKLHRDVKPSNVLLSAATGAVKLADFGLAADLASSLGAAASAVGTCRYMAPERIRGAAGGGAPYSYPADVWSAGVVVYEAATGAYPFGGPGARGGGSGGSGSGGGAGTYIEVAEAIVSAPEVTVPPDVASALTPAFAEFVAGALARDPAARAPADALLRLPWFRAWGIAGLDDAQRIVAAFLAGLPPLPPPGGPGSA